MKHRIFLFLLLLSAITAHAQTFVVDNIGYKILSEEDKTCTIFASRGDIEYTDIIIPSEMEYNGSKYSVTEIGDRAFYNAKISNSISIPPSIKRIGKEAFWLGLYPQKVEFSSIESMCSIEYVNVNSTPFGRNLYIDGKQITDLVIPETIDSIGDYTFNCWRTITSVTFPKSLKKIGREAFAECRGLESVTMSESIEKIEAGAFNLCSNLAWVDYPSLEKLFEIEYGGDYASPLSSASLLYINGKKVYDITVPESVTSIKDYTFYNSKALESIKITDGVTSIGNFAFYGSSLNNVELPNSLISIGNDAFGRAGLKNIELPNSLISIGNGAFSGAGLKNISIPNSVTTIGDRAFSYLKLENISIPNSITSIGKRTFEHSSIEKIELPNSLITIEDSAFIYTTLGVIDIPCSVRNIGFEAFAGSSISTLTLLLEPGAVIGNLAFYETKIKRTYIESIEQLCGITFSSNPLSCSNEIYMGDEPVREIEIPASVTSIGFSTFWVFKNIKSLKLHNSIESIGDQTFIYAKSLEKVIYDTNTPITASKNVFSDEVYSNAVLVMPKEGMAAAEKITPWMLFRHTEVLDDSGIGDVVIDRNDGPVAVYNLQGLKVADSTACLPAGIYIVKQGAKTKKIIIQ